MSVSVPEMSSCGVARHGWRFVGRREAGGWPSPGLQMCLQMAADVFAGRLTPATVGRETGQPGLAGCLQRAESRQRPLEQGLLGMVGPQLQMVAPSTVHKPSGQLDESLPPVANGVPMRVLL